ncbi:MAG: SH3 domain-containing protein [Caldilineaceae bacterium]
MRSTRTLLYLLLLACLGFCLGSRTASAASPPLLPAPLYFIDGATRQLMRLERDGVTLLAITHETAPITDFDVSPSDGSLVYVSGYSLIQTDLRGEHRVVKVTDTPLKPASDEAAIFHQIRAPRFSPDGKQIAFGLGGINFLDSATRSYHVDLFNDPFHGFPSDGRHFWPDSWSPDGKRLLLNFSNYGAGGGQVIYELATGRLIDITAPQFDLAVGVATWSQDSKYYVLTPGLARVDSATGSVTPIVPPIKTQANKGGALYPWGTKPYLDKAGHLLSFIGWVNSANQNLRVPAQVALDTGSLTPLRDQSYESDDTLWAPDGSGALLLNIVNSDAAAPIPYGVNQLRWWVRADGSVHDLPHRAILSHWGFALEQTGQAQTVATEQPTLKPSAPMTMNVLPAPLYFIDGATRQIARLAMDGATHTQVTHEISPVIDFDVSPVDGRLVYVSNNTLIETDAMGKGRVVKVNGGPVALNEYTDTLTKLLSSPLYSPDGAQIAFSYNGIDLISSGSSTDVRVLQPNDPSFARGEQIKPNAQIYKPVAWSPDGTRLLLRIAFYPEGQSWGVVVVNSASPTQLVVAPEARCCHAVWSPDSKAIFITANGEYTAPGFWRMAADSGAITQLATTCPTCDLGTNLRLDIGYLHPLGPDAWLSFATQQPQVPSLQPYSMFRIAINQPGLAQRNVNLTRLRNDKYSLWDARWTSDGRGAVVVERKEGEGMVALDELGRPGFNAPLLWLPADGSPAVRLPIAGSQPHWGVAPQPAPTPGLQEQFLQDFGFKFGIDLNALQILSLQSAKADQNHESLWLVSTKGDLAGLTGNNALAIYAQTSTGWQVRAQMRLNTPEWYGEDRIILDDQSVRQVTVEPTHIWLQVVGKTQTVRSTYHLLSFTDKTLKIEAANITVATNAGRLTDLNGDGVSEVLLPVVGQSTHTQACAFLDTTYTVMRWQNGHMAAVTLNELASSAPKPLRDINQQAMQAAKAGEWVAASSSIALALAQDSHNITVTWNAAVIDANVTAKQDAIAQLDQPLLGYIQAGDFTGATNLVLRAYPVDQIFNTTSKLNLDTFSQCSNLQATIKENTDSSLSPLLDTADAHFLHAWVSYLLDRDDPTVLTDVKRAFELAPTDPLFADAYAYLRGDINTPATPQLTARTVLNVRVEPGTNAQIIGQLAASQSVLVTAKQTLTSGELWWQIIYPPQSGGRGWVSGDENLVWTRRVETVPEAEEQPLTIPLAVERHPEVRTLLVARGAPGRLYALLTDEPELSQPATHAQLLISDDFGKTWTPFAGGLPVGDKCLFNLNLDYATADALYASTCQGLYRWEKPKWQRISTVVTGLLAVAPGKPNEFWATTPQGWLDGPFLHSTNGGQSWLENKAITHFNGVANLMLDPRTGKVGYAVIWPKYGGSYLRHAMLITDTAQIQWQVMATPGANQPINTGIAIDPNTSDLYVVAGPTYNQIWRGSHPNGNDLQAIHWELWYDFGENVWVNLLASGWSPQGLAFYANVGPRGASTLYRSLNYGKTWEPLLIELAE